jgi:hypothetical protein
MSSPNGTIAQFNPESFCHESRDLPGIENFIKLLNSSGMKDYIENNLKEFHNDPSALLLFINIYVYIMKMLNENQLECSDKNISNLMNWTIKNRKLRLELIKHFTKSKDYITFV